MRPNNVNNYKRIVLYPNYDSIKLSLIFNINWKIKTIASYTKIQNHVRILCFWRHRDICTNDIFLHFICVNEIEKWMLICKSRQTLAIVSFCDACNKQKTKKRYEIQTVNGANMRKLMHMHWNWNQFIVGCVLLNFNQKRKSNLIIQKQKLCRVRHRYRAVFFWIWKYTYYVFMRKKHICWPRIDDWNCTHFTM